MALNWARIRRKNNRAATGRLRSRGEAARRLRNLPVAALVATPKFVPLSNEQILLRRCAKDAAFTYDGQTTSLLYRTQGTAGCKKVSRNKQAIELNPFTERYSSLLSLETGYQRLVSEAKTGKCSQVVFQIFFEGE